MDMDTVRVAAVAELDPAVRLLVSEIRRGQDALREDLVAASGETTTAVRALAADIRDLRKGGFYLGGAAMIVVLVCLFGLLSSRGVDVAKVADAVHAVTPASAAP